MTTTIDLLRHGQVAGKPALYGKTDVALSQYGYRQMLSQEQHAGNIDCIISSPLQRCLKGASALAEKKNIAVYQEPDIAECNFGDVDGIPYDDAGDSWPAMEAFWHAPAVNTLPSGETLSAFHLRVINAWSDILSEHKGRHCLMVTHGGVIKQIIAHVLAIDWRQATVYQHLTIGYGSLTRITLAAHADAQPALQFIGIPPPIDDNANRGGEA